MERKYTALRTIGTIYKILGIVVGIITVLVIVAFCAMSILGGAALGEFGRQLGSTSDFGGIFSGVFVGVISSLVAVIYGGGLSVTLYAVGEGIYLLLALEENTRATTMALHALAARSSQSKP